MVRLSPAGCEHSGLMPAHSPSRKHGSSWTLPWYLLLSFYCCVGLTTGNVTTSRILVLPVRSITNRSTPMPQPPVGGNPYSRALQNTVSALCASGSPCARICGSTHRTNPQLEKVLPRTSHHVCTLPSVSHEHHNHETCQSRCTP